MQRISAILAALLAASMAAGQTPSPPTFAVQVRVVYVSVTAQDAATRANVSDLEQSDFWVSENGRRQDIVYFSREEQPVRIVLMLDVSNSMEQQLPSVMDAAQLIVDHLRPQDMAKVVMFSKRLHVAQDWTSDHAALLKAIEEVPDGDNTVLYTSLIVTLADLQKVAAPDGQPVRKAIILLTDGLDTSGDATHPRMHTDDDALAKAKSSDVTIYSVLMPQPYTDPNRQKKDEEIAAERFLKVLAEGSGGIYFTPRRMRDLKGTYERIAQDVAVQYSIGYTPSEDAPVGSERIISMGTPGRPNTLLRHRRFYIVTRAPRSR